MGGEARDQASMNQSSGQSHPSTPPGECATCPLRAKLVLGVFFDGTGNNKDRDKPKGGHTNVARLWEVYKEHQTDAVVQKKWYTIGVGAKDMDKVAEEAMEMDRYSYGGMGGGMSPGASHFLGQWLGQKIEGGFGAGGKERLNNAYDWVKSQLGQVGAEDEKVVDIFGFSRGAALARTFANLIVQGMVQGKGGETVVPRLRVRFVGIFDTVGSFGKPGDNYNPGQAMYIENLGIARISHFTARHEMRQNFPLTMCGGADVEYAGAHSDVGGGYEPGFDGRKNHLARVPLKDMWVDADGVMVDMDHWTGVSEIGDGEVERLRGEAQQYWPAGAIMYAPGGEFDQNRTKFYNDYIHKSHDTGIGMGADSSGRRRKFVPKQRELTAKPPGFKWSGER